MKISYDEFRNTSLSAHWEKIGIKRRSGVAAPLFSIFSKKSVGVGELPDLVLLADWCLKTRQSLIQLLPLNDVGTNFRPYDAESSFALEPMHLSLTRLKDFPAQAFKSKIESLRKKFASKGLWFDPSVKKEKLTLLYEVYLESEKKPSKKFALFVKRHHDWLHDYALFRVIKDKMKGRSWEEWPQDLKERLPEAIRSIEKSEAPSIRFQKWLQWQLYEQLCDSHRALTKKGIFLMGDIPFLVSRDSADVWAYRKNFKLNFSSGAPPDLYFADGQEWGMPPYDWDYLALTDYSYFVRKLKFAANFYDLYRIDHFIGLFRLWIFPRKADEGGKRKGFFDPSDEQVWEAQGRKILSAFLKASTMLPCAEDLGTVPLCATRVLSDEAIPGMEIQRWTRDWDHTCDFKEPGEYRKNAVATLSTHDMNAFNAWWECETTADERNRFWQYLGLEGSPQAHASASLLTSALKKTAQSQSIFCIQALQDWLSLGHLFGKANPEVRINVPGVVSSKNWTLRAPVPLEEWGKFPFNSTIHHMHRESDRI